jgi:teichoic acid transport system ATP-binding protein
MSSGLQGRWLAPLALLGVLLAVAFIVTSSTGGGSDEQPAASQDAQSETQTRTGTETGERADRKASRERPPASTTSTTPRTGKETYEVQTGDTFGSIAEETGVSVEELQELNPTVDPQALTVGQDLKLAR